MKSPLAWQGGRPLRLRVVGGPHAGDFKVYDDETGDELTNVLALSVTFSGSDQPVVKVELLCGFVADVRIDAMADEFTVVGV